MINGPGLPPASAGGSQPNSSVAINLANLRPGQQVHATVLHVEGLTLSLAIGSKKVNVPLQGAPKLTPGDQLVLEGGAEPGTVAVKELIRKNNSALNRAALDALWRGAAGRDQSLRPLSHRLQQALGPLQPGNSLAQAPALRALNKGLAALPLPALTGETLRAALEESGVFFEARLQRGLETEGDRRGQLLQAQGQLRAQNPGPAPSPSAASPGRQGLPSTPPAEPLPPSQGSAAHASATARLSGALPPTLGYPPSRVELRRRGADSAVPSTRTQNPTAVESSEESLLLRTLEQQVDQGLARVRLLQHHTLSQEPDEPSWLLELPVANGDGEDLWRLQFQGHGRRTGEASEARRWMARIAVAPTARDRVEGQITLQGEQLTGHLWCERSTTERRLSAALSGLREHLANKGFTVGQFMIHEGRAPRHLQVWEPGARP